MKVLNHILNFYINSSIHVALSVFSLSWITLIEFDVSFDNNVLFFVFFATITGYNFVKYFGLAKFHHRRLANWLRYIQIFSFFCFLALVFYVLQLQTTTLFYIGGFAAITFMYAIPFLPRKIFLDNQQNLRSISGLKIYVIGLVWSGVTVFLPLINNEIAISSDVIITALQRFIFVMVLMLPFEIRDLQYDSVKLSTIPQRIGERLTKLGGVLLLFVFFFLEYFKNELNSNNIITLLIITVLTLLFVVFARKKQGKYYSGFWVESIPILWLLLILIS